MKVFAFKFMLLSVIISGVIFWVDSLEVWNPLELNEEYTYARWNALHDISEQHDIDVLMMGNSRIYNGINPELLAAKTGTLPFILGAPGTSIIDQYFSFKAAIKTANVRMLVVETSCINNYDKSAKNIVYHLKSFSAKKGFITKLESTPALFEINHWPYAWFKSIRNHNYLFDTEQDFEKNREDHEAFLEKIQKGEDEKYMGIYELYLGRFNKNNGLTQKTLDRYKNEGPPVDGRDWKIGEKSRYFVKKLDELCRKENIELVFITIPVYVQHIKNYEAQQAAIAELIEPLGRKWCDLQTPFDTNAFSPDCFEDTYESGQHTTKQGSLVATAKFAQFLKENFDTLLPNRSQERAWNELFYGQDYYFYSHPLKPNDPKNRTLGPIYSTDGVLIDQVCFQEQTIAPTLFAKVKRTRQTENMLKEMSLRVNLSVRNKKNQIEMVALNLPYSEPCSFESHLIFTNTMKKLNVNNIHGMKFYPTKLLEEAALLKRQQTNTSSN